MLTGAAESRLHSQLRAAPRVKNFSRRWCGLASLAFAALLLAACTSGSSQQFSTALANKLQSVRPTEIDLATVSAITWDELFIFGPYSMREANCSALKLDLFECRTTFPEMVGEGDNVLVFRRNGKVMRAEVHPRANGDFSSSIGTPPPRPVLRAAARFSVVATDKVRPEDPPRFRLEYKP